MNPISPRRYPGGKTFAVKKFNKYVPTDVTSLCSPFLGGGSFELHCLRNYGIKIFAYDFFEPLVAFWNCVLEDPERLAATVSRYLPVVTRVQFYRLQRTFMQIGDRWERAAATYVLNRTSFSGAIASGGFSSLKENGRNGRFHQGNVNFLRNFRIPSGMLSVDLVSFDESILRHSDEFLFVDPPYMVESKLYGRRGNLQAIDHVLLADILHSRDNWMLCYNDCPEIRLIYRGFPFVDKTGGLDWNYGMNDSKQSNEILILSRDVAERLGTSASKRVCASSRRAVHEGVPLVG